MKQSTTKASLLEVILVAEHLLSALLASQPLFLLLPRFGRRELLLLLDLLDPIQLVSIYFLIGKNHVTHLLPMASKVSSSSFFSVRRGPDP